MPSVLSPAQLARFNADGFVIVRGMFDAPETDLLRTAMDAGHAGASGRYDRLDDVARQYAFAIASIEGRL